MSPSTVEDSHNDSRDELDRNPQKEKATRVDVGQSERVQNPYIGCNKRGPARKEGEQLSQNFMQISPCSHCLGSWDSQSS